MIATRRRMGGELSISTQLPASMRSYLILGVSES